MARTPDKPGTYRVKQRGGEWIVTGKRHTGDRLKLRAHSPDEAERLARSVFGPTESSGPSHGSIGPIQGSNPLPERTQPAGPTPVDDWGFPIRISAAVADTLASTLNIPAGTSGGVAGSTNGVPTPQVDAKEEADKKARRAKHAKSLMEMAGMGWAAGTVAISRRVVTNAGKEPVNPNPKQVNDLADCTKETFVEWFGDREIKPWQMMFLLTLGIPMAMWLQSPKAKTQPEAKLKSVP